MIELASLHVYPVKSCRGVDPSEWTLDAYGLAHDRHRMVVDLEGNAVTQREQHALARVRAEVGSPADPIVVLTVPGAAPIALDERREGATRMVRVFAHRGPAVDEGDAAAEALSSFLGKACRLVRIGRDHRRPLDPAFHTGPEEAAFADGFPLLIASESSLSDLNARLDEPVPMRRFRPNLVVRGCAPFAEDGWKRIRVGAVELAIVKPCDRCVITTVDQDTGAARGPEPLRTLATFRRGARGVAFGQNAVALSGGSFKLGDRVEILEEG